MRLDAGGENWHDAYTGRVHCYLNGEEVENVRCADEEQGLVTGPRIGADGKIIICGGEVTEETRYGDVKIVFDEPPERLIGQYRHNERETIRYKWRWLCRVSKDCRPLEWPEFNRRARDYARRVNTEIRETANGR